MSLGVTWFVVPAIVAIGRAGADWPKDVIADEVVTQSSEDQYQALASGTLDLAVTAMDNVIGWNLRGGPDDFVIIAQMERTTPLCVVARSEFHSLASLEGADLLVDSPDNGFVVPLRALLLDAGVATDAYRLTPAGGVKERFEAMVNKIGDATLLGPPFDQFANAAGLRVLANVQDVYPSFPGQGLVVRRSTLAQMTREIRLLLTMLRKSLNAIQANPVAAATALVEGGFSASIAEALVAIMPTSLVPSRNGVQLLLNLRSKLGLPVGSDSPDTLVDWQATSQESA